MTLGERRTVVLLNLSSKGREGRSRSFRELFRGWASLGEPDRGRELDH